MGDEIYDYIVSELTAIRDLLPPNGAASYGRATPAAASMLLAKMYLNSAGYTGTARWTEALAATQAVINSGGISLDPNYRRMFGADNHTSPEIIFAVTQDGLKTTDLWRHDLPGACLLRRQHERVGLWHRRLLVGAA